MTTAKKGVKKATATKYPCMKKEVITEDVLHLSASKRVKFSLDEDSFVMQTNENSYWEITSLDDIVDSSPTLGNQLIALGNLFNTAVKK